MILYSSIISTPVSMTKNQYPPNSGPDLVALIDTRLAGSTADTWSFCFAARPRLHCRSISSFADLSVDYSLRHSF